MTEIGLLKEAGAVAFTDGDRTIANARVMRRALAYAATFDALVVGHAEDPDLAEGAAITEGEFATRLGLPAAPAAAEAMIVERDIRLVELTGARYHFGQISCRACAGSDRRRQGARAADHLRRRRPSSGAERAGRRPLLHLLKVKPPLRSEADRAAMVEGVASGVIDVIVSSHEPQGADTKRQPFAAGRVRRGGTGNTAARGARPASRRARRSLACAEGADRRAGARSSASMPAPSPRARRPTWC